MLGTVAFQYGIVSFATFLKRKHRFPTAAVTLQAQPGKLMQVEEGEQADVDGIEDAPRQAGGRPQPDENETEWGKQDGCRDKRLPGVEPVV